MSLQRKMNKGGSGKPPWWTDEGQALIKASGMTGPNPNLPPGHVQVRPMMFEGSTALANREGGLHDLWVHETSTGVYTSAWATHNKKVRAAILRKHMVLTVVVDTNVPGHPSISLVMQPVGIIKD